MDDEITDALIDTIKIDFTTFHELHEKYKLRKLFDDLDGDWSDLDEEIKKRIFQSMDIDENGLISEFELKEWIKRVLQIDADVEDEADVQELLDRNKKVRKESFEKADSDRDGQVTYEEFDKCIEKLYKECVLTASIRLD